jgi:hypothetical protein
MIGAAPTAWWELTCRSCGEVGYTPRPPGEWAAMLRRHLRDRCPDCGRERPRQRRLRAVPALAVPAWILESAAETPPYFEERGS